jgi:hypothetical protein
MQTKFIFSTENNDLESWLELPFVPRIGEWIAVPELIEEKDYLEIKRTANCWSGHKGVTETVYYRKGNNGCYAEVMVWCED